MKNTAFSLIELSIVLVILGLITGGILTGQSLIKASELRTVTTEATQFTTAINAFKDKYFALPGDMTNATEFWGRADDGTFSGQCASPDSDTGTGTQTCNGDGDGNVTYGTNEMFRPWQHLANAKLISGTFTGITGYASTEHCLIGENCPSSAFSGGGWSFFTRTPQANWFSTAYDKLLLQIGAEAPSFETAEPLFTTEEAWSIDQKTDDGKPGLGKILTQNPNYVPCATSTDEITAEYDLNYKEVACQLIFLLK